MILSFLTYYIITLILISLYCYESLRVLFFAAVVAALAFMPWEFKIAAITVAMLRYFVVMFVVVRNAARLGETGLTAMHFIYDIIEPFLRLFLVLFSYKKYKKSWL